MASDTAGELQLRLQGHVNYLTLPPLCRILTALLKLASGPLQCGPHPPSCCGLTTLCLSRTETQVRVALAKALNSPLAANTPPLPCRLNPCNEYAAHLAG